MAQLIRRQAPLECGILRAILEDHNDSESHPASNGKLDLLAVRQALIETTNPISFHRILRQNLFDLLHLLIGQ